MFLEYYVINNYESLETKILLQIFHAKFVNKRIKSFGMLTHTMKKLFNSVDSIS